MNNITKIIIYCLSSGIVVFFIGFIFLKIKKKKNKIIKDLDKKKNMLENLSIPAELTKVEMIIKNEKIEEKYNNWKERYETIKNDNIVRLNDMIIDLDISTSKKNY